MKQENFSESVMDGAICKTFEIKGTFFKENCLPDLNNLLSEATRHPMAYASMKRQMETVVINAVRMQLKGWQATNRVRLDITWGEKVKGSLRDYDNVVSAGRKIINDALVKTKTIADDNPRFLGYGNNEFVYTDKPFIRVEIVEIEEFKK